MKGRDRMSKFNKSKEKLTTYEGGRAYHRSLLKQWVNYMMGNRIEPGFYEDNLWMEEQIKHLTEEVINTYGAGYAAKVAIFSRDVLGMRSVSQFVAAMLNGYTFEGKRAFYVRFFSRPDDVAEVFAILENYGWKRSHALIRGAADYISSLDAYTLGKYKLARKNFNMYDIVNITHAHSAAINQLKNGTLENPDTWEVAISANMSGEERHNEWIRLVQEGKLGYMALLRNLRNIGEAYSAQFRKLKNHAEFVDEVVSQLTNEQKIRGSKVFPYRIYTACLYLQKGLLLNGYFVEQVTSALEQAFIIATNNVPELEGRNVVVLDVSGSMDQPISERSEVSVLEASACQALIMLLRNPDTAVIKFGLKATVSTKYSDANVSPFKYLKYLCDNEDCGHATNLGSVVPFLGLMGNIDRIFLYSDMQVMNKRYATWGFETQSFNSWVCDHNVYVYSYDLGMYSGSAVSDNNQFMFISALNDAIYELIPYFEQEDGIGKFIDQMQVKEN